MVPPLEIATHGVEDFLMTVFPRHLVSILTLPTTLGSVIQRICEPHFTERDPASFLSYSNALVARGFHRVKRK